MQTQVRQRDNGVSFAPRRGHLQQLSISDEQHHVTEAIGYMYEDDDNEGRRSSHGSSLNPTSPVERRMQDFNESPRRNSIPRKAAPVERRISNGNVVLGPSNARAHVSRQNSWDRQSNGSPHARERSPSDTAHAHFPLNDVDYESSPAAVAQELSNLQALRRMSMISMDGGAAGDPDLPHLNAAALPQAPSATASEDDASRLFWVPARLHPELAPKEFKSFLDSKAEQIKRRSGELSQFTTPNTSRSNSSSSLGVDNGGLRRKKSMLSRQIDSSVGYQDGAERLERKKSLSRQTGSPDPNLSTLEALVSGEPMNRLSLESPSQESQEEDIILPSVPGASLKRSRRTNYRRGGSVKGGRPERATYAQRAARRVATHGDSPITPATPEVPQMPTFASNDVSNLAQTLKDPSIPPSPTSPGIDRIGNRQGGVYNFSRPPTLGRQGAAQSVDPPNQAAPTFDSILGTPSQHRSSSASTPDRTAQSVSGAPADRTVPQIIETPAPEELERPSTAPSPVQVPVRHPERSSSREQTPFQRPGMPPKQSSSVNAVPTLQQQQSQPPPQPQPTPTAQRYMSNQQYNPRPQSLEQPSPLPGNNTNTTDLSFIPTLTVDKRADHKTKEEGKKSGWGWLLGKEEKEKDKAEKPKAKIVKPPQSHDNTRLDVLQTSIEGNKGRESVVLDRESLKLDEERKKESARKSSGEGKKEKEGLFSSLFGKKGKAEKEATKKYKDRLSPEPTLRELKPDIDYNWTRFSILEERAIYRMAHIKLANPRRALYSQVLLSNFMYSYLAKVQQMHPQMNLPTSAKQQRKQKEQQTQQPAQPEEFTQYQRYQQQQQPQNTPAPATTPEPQQQPQVYAYQPQQGYEVDSQYDYDASQQQRTSSRGSHQKAHAESNGYGGNAYHHNQSNQSAAYRNKGDDDDEDMW